MIISYVTVGFHATNFAQYVWARSYFLGHIHGMHIQQKSCVLLPFSFTSTTCHVSKSNADIVFRDEYIKPLPSNWCVYWHEHCQTLLAMWSRWTYGIYLIKRLNNINLQLPHMHTLAIHLLVNPLNNIYDIHFIHLT